MTHKQDINDTDIGAKTADLHHVDTVDFKKLPDNSVVCLMAPTASGKTSLAYELYDTGRFEIISVDSALIYKDMNIGTAKPSAAELANYPHHLVDIISPTETYSVANFVDDVEVLINKIHSRGKIPLLVGGTMMYYMALFNGLSPVPDTDFSIRKEVETWRQQDGITKLHEYLQKVDPAIAKRLNLTDTQRITRAVEVFKQTGKPLSYWQQLPKVALANNPKQSWIGLAVMPDRGWLHTRIELRLKLMWQEGLLDEVVALLKKYPLTPENPSMRCVGYRQVLEFLIMTKHPVTKSFLGTGFHESISKNQNGSFDFTKNRLNLAEKAEKSDDVDTELACQTMINKSLYATRQLAKRQYTWLRNMVASYANYKDDLNVNNLNENQSSEQHNCQQNTYGIVVYKFDNITNAKQFLLTRL